MQKSADVLELEQKKLKNKVRNGDFILLGQMLNITKDAAKMRFYRGKEDAVLGLKKIIETRENLIENHQPKK